MSKREGPGCKYCTPPHKRGTGEKNSTELLQKGQQEKIRDGGKSIISRVQPGDLRFASYFFRGGEEKSSVAIKPWKSRQWAVIDKALKKRMGGKLWGICSLVGR